MVNLATFSVVTCIVLDSQFTFLECFLNLLAFGVQFSTLWFHNIHQSFLAECGLLCQICIVELLKFLLLLTEFLPEFIIGFSLLINFTELLYILWSKSLSCVLSLFVDALHSEYAWLGEGEVGHVVYILFHVLKFSQTISKSNYYHLIRKLTNYHTYSRTWSFSLMVESMLEIYSSMSFRLFLSASVCLGGRSTGASFSTSSAFYGSAWGSMTCWWCDPRSPSLG